MPIERSKLGVTLRNPNKEYYFSDYSRRNLDSEGILADVRNNFKGAKYQNVRNNIKFTGRHDKIACPIMISNYTGTKKRAFPDAIGIGFAKSGTGSLAMLRLVLKHYLN